MTTYGVLIKNSVAANKVDAWNRSFTSGSDIRNGYVFQLSSLDGTTGSEVWSTSVPATGSLTGLWMASSPENPYLTQGSKTYRGLGDVQDFYLPAGYVGDAFKLQVGDIVTITDDSVASAIGTNDYLYASNGLYTLSPGASLADSACGLQVIDRTYISKSSGSTLGDQQRITAYKCVVLVN